MSLKTGNGGQYEELEVTAKTPSLPAAELFLFLYFVVTRLGATP